MFLPKDSGIHYVEGTSSVQKGGGGGEFGGGSVGTTIRPSYHILISFLLIFEFLPMHMNLF